MSLDLSSEAITWTGAEQYCLEVMKRLDIQRRSEEFCDVILNVGSGIHQARLKAHRNVLSAASPFFYNALNSDMKEKEEGVISLEETSKTIMDGVLEYMYTGFVDVSAENVPELFAQADYFILPSLTSFLSNFIIQTLSLSNCVKAYYLACKYQCERLMKETRGFILSNFVAVAKTEDFLNLSCEQVEEWISSDEVVVDVEEKVFEVVLRWAERDESRKQNDFRDLFRHLRCGYVSRDYLFEVLLPHPLVRENSGCLSSAFNAMKSALDGTEECLFLQAPRQCLKSHEDTVVACRENRALCYLPPTQKWFELPKMNSSFRSPEQTEHAIGVCHGRLYIIGRTTTRGYGSTSCVAERYEPSLNKWFQVNPPANVASFFAVATLQGFIYILGGKDSQNTSRDSVQKYNPDTNMWQEVLPLSSPRAKVCAIADGSYLYAIGGSDSANQYLDIVERFDPRSNTWNKLPSMHSRRASASGAAIKKKVFVFGGTQPEGVDGHACEMYDPDTKVWSAFASQVAPRITSAVSFKGKIYVFGTFRDVNGHENAQGLQVYDADQNHWESCINVPVFNTFLQISCLRIPIHVLAKCNVLLS